MVYRSGVGVYRVDEQISMVEALQVSDGILVTSAGIVYAAIAPKTPLIWFISHSWISIARQFCIEFDRRVDALLFMLTACSQGWYWFDH